MKKDYFMKNKMVRPLGLLQQSGRGYGVMPLTVMKKSITKHLGRGTTSLLLSTYKGSASLGNGFGVKTNNPNLIQKLGNLSLGNNKQKKNVKLIL
jgi:hypothetical protein